MADFCKVCGASNEPGAVYCARCGSALVDDDLNLNPYATPTHSGANDYAAWDDPTAPDVPTGPISAFRVCFFKKFVNFRGRASRSEYWYWILACFLIGLLLGAVVGVIGPLLGLSVAETSALGAATGRALQLIFLLPGLAVAARRLHDRDQSGWLLLFLFVPFANIVALVACFILFLLPGKPEPNQYGPAPRRRAR